MIFYSGVINGLCFSLASRAISKGIAKQAPTLTLGSHVINVSLGGGGGGGGTD